MRHWTWGMSVQFQVSSFKFQTYNHAQIQCKIARVKPQ